MEQSWTIALVVIAAALPGLLLLLLILGYAKKLYRTHCIAASEPAPIDRRDAALKRSAQMSSLWRSNIPLRAFHWTEHASHVVTAVEHGWAAFAFSYAASARGAFAGPVHQMWEMCSSCAAMKFCVPEISWIASGAGEYMQQIRLNPGIRSNKDGCVLPVQALQTALPLPGPQLGPFPYPQDAYFEISILAAGNEFSSEHSSLAGSERVKLIAESITSDRYQKGQSLTDLNGSEFCRKLDAELRGIADQKNETRVELSHQAGANRIQVGEAGQPGDVDCPSLFHKVDQIDWDELLSVGLAGAEAPPFRLLGFDPGSVGFLSADGQCYVNGK